MTFSIWLGIVIAAIAAIFGALMWLQNHRKEKLDSQKAKDEEWSVVRMDYNAWIIERKDSRKVKLYGYVISQISGNYGMTSKVFDEPQLFVKGSKFGIHEELQGDDWELVLYYVDVTHEGNVEVGQFPKDADSWVNRLV